MSSWTSSLPDSKSNTRQKETVPVSSRFTVFRPRCASCTLDAQNLRKEISCTRFVNIHARLEFSLVNTQYMLKICARFYSFCQFTRFYFLCQILDRCQILFFSVQNSSSTQGMRKIGQEIAWILQLDCQDIYHFFCQSQRLNFLCQSVKFKFLSK